MKLRTISMAVLLSAMSVDASATCNDDGCDYKDSGAWGCRDGRQFTAKMAAIKTSSGGILGHVDLVYSPTCTAAWGYVASAIGPVESVLAQVARKKTGSQNIDSPYRECSNCSSMRSPMMGDGLNEQAQASGWMHLNIIISHPIFTATTGWY